MIYGCTFLPDGNHEISYKDGGFYCGGFPEGEYFIHTKRMTPNGDRIYFACELIKERTGEVVAEFFFYAKFKKRKTGVDIWFEDQIVWRAF